MLMLWGSNVSEFSHCLNQSFQSAMNAVVVVVVAEEDEANVVAGATAVCMTGRVPLARRECFGVCDIGAITKFFHVLAIRTRRLPKAGAVPMATENCRQKNKAPRMLLMRRLLQQTIPGESERRLVLVPWMTRGV